MANIELGWQVDGTIQPTESVQGMLRVIEEKDEKDNGTFWCWDGRVSFFGTLDLKSMLIKYRATLGRNICVFRSVKLIKNTFTS
jgi:hypothetical protein